MTKRQITIPLGPQHPSQRGPACIKITQEGDIIVAVQAELGYNHRGLEKACEARSFAQDLYLIERVCGVCSHVHSMTFCQAVEELAGVEITLRAAFIRTVIAELERIHSHMMWFGMMAYEIGFEALFMSAWRDREKVLDVLADLCQNRVHYGINTFGGVKQDLSDDMCERILQMLSVAEQQTQAYLELVERDSMLLARMGGIGRLNQENAVRLGAIGPVARASGVETDVRLIQPYAAYEQLNFSIVIDNRCDMYARTLVRLKEILVSISLIRSALDNLPTGALSVKVPSSVPAGMVMCRTEAPRGENIHFVRSLGKDKPDRVHIRSASLINWETLETMLIGAQMADAPAIIASIDPCYACTDRMFVIRQGREEQTMDWAGLRAYGVDCYRKKGVDFTASAVSKAK